MSFSDYLAKIQNQPRHVRVLIMWVGVAIFMTLFLILWVATLDSGQENKTLVSENQFLSQSQTFSEIKDQAPSFWQSLKAGITDLLNSASKSETSQPKVEVQGGAPQSNQNVVPPATLP
jgi:hypothetical protein